MPALAIRFSATVSLMTLQVASLGLRAPAATADDASRMPMMTHEALENPAEAVKDYGAKANQAVPEAVFQANAAVQAANDMVARMVNLKPWIQATDAAKAAQVAGLEAQKAAVWSRPYIYSQVSKVAHNGAGSGVKQHHGHSVQSLSLRWLEDDSDSRPRGIERKVAHASKEDARVAVAARHEAAKQAVLKDKVEDAARKTSAAKKSTQALLRPRNATSRNATNATKPTQSPLPQAPLEGALYAVDSRHDPRKAWPCVEVKASRIPGAGKGLFALRDIKKDTLLGEYVGKNFMIGERGSAKELEADWSYIWKVPRCLAPKNKLVVITRADKKQAHECSNDNGFIYVDALPLEDPKANPMRYVNGAMTEAQSKTVNVEAFFADDRVWYFTTRDVKQGDEFMVDYGKGYWKEAKTESDFEGDEADWSNFVADDNF